MHEYAGTVIRVVDGDTLDVRVKLGFGVCTVQRLRLARINTPEVFGVKFGSPEYVAGKRASAFVAAASENAENEVTIATLPDKGKFGRYIAEVWFGDNPDSINTILLEEGLAEAYPKDTDK